MNHKVFHSALAAVFLLAVSTVALAQNTAHVYTGLINDYTPGTTVSPVGPWEIRGDWTLIVAANGSTATFSANLTMVRSDYWIVLNPMSQDTPDDRSPHTHHIVIDVGMVTQIANGFQVDGSATIMANGSPAGFSPSPLSIQVIGGTGVPYSNIKLTFGTPANGHFGTYSIDGVVRGRPQ